MDKVLYRRARASPLHPGQISAGRVERRCWIACWIPTPAVPAHIDLDQALILRRLELKKSQILLSFLDILKCIDHDRNVLITLFLYLCTYILATASLVSGSI